MPTDSQLVQELYDGFNTLLGQPSTYWQNPATVNELDPFIRFFATKGYFVFASYWLIFSIGAFVLVSILPKRLGLIGVFTFIFPHYFGATSWWVYRWGYGTKAAMIYGIVLAVIVVLIAFPKHDKQCSENSPK